MHETLEKRRPRRAKRKAHQKALHRLIENDMILTATSDEYRNKVKRVYGGPKGAMLATCSMLSLHIPLGERLFKTRKFDLHGMQSILDVGSGAGQLASHLLKYSDPGAKVTCTDLSNQMLRRARNRLKSSRPDFVAADLSHLPFADESFDGVTCGYVLEHLPDPRPGLAEMARVLARGGRMLLLTTEDSFSGAWTSRLWYCRTFNRQELMRICEELGLIWKQELWFTKMHKVMRAGGICVEIEKA
ncbi:MAG: class I SAM-dependent methyltransferase [Planctomycetales bacterium]|nr:class I SAM-dependent methyltransferase [Planctomycetales bacterium]